MWKYPNGERWVCKDPEVKVVREAIIDVWAVLEAEGRSYEQHQDESTKPPAGLHPLIREIWRPWSRMVFGIELFDHLAWNQRLALLALATTALFSETESPQRTAYLDAAICAVWSYIEHQVLLGIRKSHEVPEENMKYIRMMADLIRFADPGPYTPCPNSRNREEDDWYKALHWYLDTFVIDKQPFIIPSISLDDPEESQQRRELHRLPDDYFTAPAPDPIPAELDQARATIAHWIERQAHET